MSGFPNHFTEPDASRSAVTAAVLSFPQKRKSRRRYDRTPAVTGVRSWRRHHVRDFVLFLFHFCIIYVHIRHERNLRSFLMTRFHTADLMAIASLFFAGYVLAIVA